MHIQHGENKIVVVGLFATGKSTLVKELQKFNPQHKVYHTDDFIQYEHSLQMRFLMNKIGLDKPEKFIIEGAAAYRLLRSGAKDNSFLPDLVINCVASEGTRQQRYLEPGRWNPGRYKGAVKGGLKDYKAFDNQYRKIWDEYLKMRKLREPRIVQYVSEPMNLN